MADSVVFRSQAEADIEAIGDRIALDSRRNAAVWVADMRRRCESLAELPERWPIHIGAVRRMAVGNYLVFFRIADPDIPNLRRVIIIRIMHGARKIERITDPGA